MCIDTERFERASAVCRLDFVHVIFDFYTF